MQIRHFRHCLVLVMLAGCVNAASAQVQVREAGTSRTAPAQPQAGNNDLLMSLYNQMEAMQQEMQTLRGLVEEQGYQIKRMQAEQKDRYLDLDRRLSAGTTNAPRNAPTAPNTVAPPSLDSSSAAANAATTVNTVPTPPPAAARTVTNNDRRSSVATPGEKDMDEQQLYRTALNLLLDDHKPDETRPKALEAVALFQNYIESYPNGRLLTNALYWQGDGYMIVGNPAKAKDVLSRLLTEFPADAKAPGAMLMLGDAYKQLGDKAKAAETWKSMKARFPEADDENKKADAYLKTL